MLHRCNEMKGRNDRIIHLRNIKESTIINLYMQKILVAEGDLVYEKN